ncbi:MAG: hypothetical protein K6T61_07180 [Bryobacteraceae bacterium]|nr:hypothetical protein [Bryobacteraceae bacterium]
MGFVVQQDEASLIAAHRFQVNAELKELRLLDCSASISPEVSAEDGELRLGLEFQPSILEHSETGASFAVKITVHGDPKTPGDSPSKRIFEVSCRFAVQYSLKEDYSPSEKELDAFKEGNAVFQCWPYARELVQNLTLRMGLHLPPLPLLRIAPRPVCQPASKTEVSAKARTSHARRSKRGT